MTQENHGVRDLEIRNPQAPRGGFRHVLFDFDGTLSLIREGWQAIMIPMFVEELKSLGTDESPAELESIVRDFVTRLTGKQTIYQMLELAEQIRKRGGTPLDPLEYKHEYLRRLEVRISERIQGLEQQTISPDSLMVPGSRELLEGLRRRGLRIYLASGTDEIFVKREVALLGIEEYFDGGIYGALDDYRQFSKKMIIHRIISENQLSGVELLGIGDGYVEIENTREAGGVALGIPVLENSPLEIDTWKRTRLIEAGADFLVTNFRDHESLVRFLCGT